jgi:hypothetical protein
VLSRLFPVTYRADAEDGCEIFSAPVLLGSEHHWYDSGSFRIAAQFASFERLHQNWKHRQRRAIDQQGFRRTAHGNTAKLGIPQDRSRHGGSAA